MALGVLLFTKSLLLAIAGTLAYILFYERIVATEERFLAEKFGQAFHDWAAHVPWLIPRLSQWTKPDNPFSFKPAIKGEFYGLAAVAVSMFLLDVADHWFIEHRLTAAPFWLYFVIIASVLFVVLRFLRKRTRLLDVSSPVEKTRVM